MARHDLCLKGARFYRRVAERSPRVAAWVRGGMLRSLGAIAPTPSNVLILVASPRSGSTFLSDCLRNSGVPVAVEPLEPAGFLGFDGTIRGAPAHLRRVARVQSTDRVALKLMIQGQVRYRLTLSSAAELFDSPASLVLYRENLLAQFVSLMLVRRTGVYQSRTSDFTAAKRFSFDPERYLRWREYVVPAYDSIVDRAPDAVISYEELIADPSAAARRLASVFPLSRDGFSSSLRKLAKADPLEHLDNPKAAEPYAADRLVHRHASTRPRFHLRGGTAAAEPMSLTDLPPLYERAIRALNGALREPS